MELKLAFSFACACCILALLIVPYGIEIQQPELLVHCRCSLLIVPYGIEMGNLRGWCQSSLSFNRTLWNWNEVRLLVYLHTLVLLIVPYGIEIVQPLCVTWHVSKLLIVPYGIEIMMNYYKMNGHIAFNRTLWNWNYGLDKKSTHGRAFNRTLWNWNCSLRSKMSPVL